MDIVENFTCECNGKTYPHKKSFNEHKKTKSHQAWEKETELFDLRCRCKRLENENACLKYDLAIYRNLLIEKM